MAFVLSGQICSHLTPREINSHLSAVFYKSCTTFTGLILWVITVILGAPSSLYHRFKSLKSNNHFLCPTPGSFSPTQQLKSFAGLGCPAPRTDLEPGLECGR